MRRLIAWMGRGPARPRLALLFALIPALKSSAGAASVSLVENGRPAAVIQVGASATLEHAAAEFRKYVRLASDAELPMVAGDQVVSENVVLIGSDRNQPTIRQLKHEGLIGLPAEPDSFLIKTIYKAGKNYLVLGAQTDRAALYAVYDFLERFLGAGFFWEGDRIPQSSSLRVGEIELAVKPRLPIRFYMQECPFNYSTKAWDLPDWTRELDWVAKKKLNLLMVPEGSWNLIVPCDEIIKAAKHRGIQPVFGGECARFDGVTEDFVKQHPEHKYVRMRWWNDPPYQVLHPGDLLFVERGRESVRRRVRQYGAGNVYFFSPYGEQTILDASAAEIREVRMQFADSILRILQAEDPQGTWLFWTWPFISPPWPREDVAAFLQKMPMRNAFVCDSSQPERPGDYHHKRFNYFEGRPWLLSFIHLYGGDDYLTGNLAKLIQDVQAMLNDPRAKNCAGIYICPEIIHYNPVYFELLARLSWDPAAVTLDGFLDDYVRRRYGPDSFATMKEAWRHLLSSVYGAQPGAEAQYQHRAGMGFGGDAQGLDLLKLQKTIRGNAVVMPLQRFLDLAFREAERQKANPCYVHDVVDVTRQLITETFNQVYYGLMARYGGTNGPLDDCQRRVGILRHLLDALEAVLAAYPDYQLRPQVAKIRSLPDPTGKERLLKNVALTFASTEWLIDYPSKDIYELVKYYYRPRMEALHQRLLAAVERGQRYSDKELLEDYRRTEQEWLKLPLSSLPADIYSSRDILAALAEAKQSVEALRREAGLPETRPALLVVSEDIPLAKVAWEENFGGAGDWRRTHFASGQLTVRDGIGELSAAAHEGTVYGVSVDIPLAEYPLLSFRMKATGQVVIWARWTDVTGRKRRNRVWQESPPADFTPITVNVRDVLSLLAEPTTLTLLEIENVMGVTSYWDWIKVGRKD